MRRRWKSIAALCLSAMIGCVLPVSTMMAAEEDIGLAEGVREPEAGELPADGAQETETGEPAADEPQETEACEPAADEPQETETGEPAADEPQETEACEPAADEPQEAETGEPAADEPQDIEAEEEQQESAEAGQGSDTALPEAELVEVTPQAAETIAETEVQEQSDKTAPVIVIRLQGTDMAQALDGKIEYDTYISNRDQRLRISVEQGSVAALCYYLDTTANASDESKSEGQLADLWQAADRVNGQEVSLGQDGRYVLYVKAETADGQTSCVRTGGIVVDATAPVITGVDNGGTYPAGTKFGVVDDNPDIVLINEQPADPSSTDGMYQVAAAFNSTSCVIRAKDKAGNETVYSITVEGEEPDIRNIGVSGSYHLKAGRDYHLGYGSWTLEGDSTVYSGGITFYVKEDGQYRFDRK